MSKQYQRGDAATVVLVVVVIALVGVLGFIAWQNFGNKDKNTSEDTTQTQQAQQQERSLAFSKWGLEVPLTNTDAQYKAFEANPGDKDVVDYGVTLENMSSYKGCDQGGQSGAAPLGHLEIVDKEYAKTMDIKYDATVTVDGKEYGWRAEPNAGSCATSQDDKQAIVTARDDMTQLVKGLRKAEN